MSNPIANDEDAAQLRRTEILSDWFDRRLNRGMRFHEQSALYLLALDLNGDSNPEFEPLQVHGLPAKLDAWYRTGNTLSALQIRVLESYLTRGANSKMSA